MPLRGADLTLASHLPLTTRRPGMALRALLAPPGAAGGAGQGLGSFPPETLQVCRSGTNLNARTPRYCVRNEISVRGWGLPGTRMTARCSVSHTWIQKRDICLRGNQSWDRLSGNYVTARTKSHKASHWPSSLTSGGVS